MVRLTAFARSIRVRRDSGLGLINGACIDVLIFPFARDRSCNGPVDPRCFAGELPLQLAGTGSEDESSDIVCVKTVYLFYLTSRCVCYTGLTRATK